jgi:hydrogenase maturation factor HypF (carbamoyltransferase family)
LKLYIKRFVKHLQGGSEARIEDSQSDENSIIAECESCHMQYDFANIKEYEADSKICEDCKGKLQLVTRDGEQSA